MTTTPDATSRHALLRVKSLLTRMNAQVDAIVNGASERGFATLKSDAQALVQALETFSVVGAPAVPDERPLILVVEDQEDNRLIYRRTLRRKYTLVEAEDGVQALELMRSQPPALVLMDISLPVMDGLDATRQAKADAALKDIPIVLVTAHAMKGNREEALATGADEYLTKPFTPSALRGLVQRFVHDVT